MNTDKNWSIKFSSPLFLHLKILSGCLEQKTSVFFFTVCAVVVVAAAAVADAVAAVKAFPPPQRWTAT